MLRRRSVPSGRRGPGVPVGHDVVVQGAVEVLGVYLLACREPEADPRAVGRFVALHPEVDAAIEVNLEVRGVVAARSGASDVRRKAHPATLASPPGVDT